METTKKRKRDVDLPRIVYDATTRVFDRLFKEDSLEGMKAVVRKKLGIPASTPVQLAQLRDGQTVDLEDDDDFEAFSSSAYKSSTAKVKVIVGGGAPPVQTNGINPTQPLLSEPAEREKKKKDKKRREALDSSRGEPETIAPQATPSESPLAKKRRVSFAEPSKKLQKELKKAALAKDRVTSPNESEGSSEQQTAQTEGTVDLDSVKDRTERRKDKKTNKHLQKLKDIESQSSKESTPAVEEISTLSKEDKKKRKRTKRGKDFSKGDEPEPQSAELTDKSAKKKLQKGHETDDAAADDSSIPKKSKKRSRTAEDDSADKPESAKEASPSSSTEPLPETETVEETERPAKKRKHKDAINVDSGDADKSTPALKDYPNVTKTAAPKTPKKSKPKSPAIVESEESEHEATALSEQPSEQSNTPKLNKKRRKSDAQPPALATPTAKRPAKKSTDSSVQRKDAPVPETIASTENDKSPKSKTKKGSDATPVHTEAKTPKKTAKTHDTSESKEELEEATRAAVQAILARKGISVAPTAAPATPTNKAAAPAPPASKLPPVINFTVAASSAKSAPSQTPSAAEVAAALGITDASLLQMSASDESLSAVISAKVPKARLIVPSGASLAKAPLSAAQIMEKAKKATANGTSETTGMTPKISAAKKKAAPPSKCPVCDEAWHVRSRCPIIKSGIRAMRKRIGELELLLTSDSEDEDDSNKANGKDGISAIIEELRQLIEKKTKKPRTSAANAHAEENAPAIVPTVKSVRVDASHPSTQVNIVPSSVVQHLLPDAESPSAQAAPSSGALRPPKPVFLVEPIISIDHLPSSTQLPPPSQPLFTTQPLTTITHRPRPSQLPPPSQPPPRKPRQSMPASIPSPFDFPTLPSSFGDLNTVPPGILGFAGNISGISDHDLDELMRGPKLTSQDVPSEDESEGESEDDQREPDAFLEEDDVDVPRPKNASRMEYPSSSDEDEEEESTPDDSAPSPATVSEDTEVMQVQQMASAGFAPTTSIAEEESEDEKEDREEKEEEPEENEDEEPEEEEGEKEAPLAEKVKTTEMTEKAVIQEEEEKEDEDAEEKGNDGEEGKKSFQEMNLSSSSRSSGKAGDAAVNDAVSADLELPTSSPAPAATSTTNSNQNSVPTAEENAEHTAAVSAPGPASQAPPIADDHAPDPIENDEPPSSQPDAILSADDGPAPIESTPKEKIALRKSQRRGSAQPSASQPPPVIQPRTTRSRDTAAGASATQPETPATVKKTHSKLLTRISELPVPIPPLAGRVTRATRSHAQAQVAAVAAAATPVPATPKPTRSRAAAASKTVAKVPATLVAAEASKAAAAKPVSKAKQAAAKPASNVTTLRTRASRLTADLESAEEGEGEPEEVRGKGKEVAADAAAAAEPDVSLVSWVVLHESQSGPSQNESDLQHGTADVDELMSSPSFNAITEGANANRESTPQQQPLFIEAESQQSYPYSQFPLTQPQVRSRSASPNDSEDQDANEVAATVVRSTNGQYRSLTEISSQSRFYEPTYSSQLTMAASAQKEVEDPFGTGQKDDEEDSEDSETESDEEKVGNLGAAHFPTTRLAGGVIPPRRR